MKKITLIPVFTTLLFIVFTFSSCNSPIKITEVTVGTFSKALGNTPYHIAKYKGWFEQDEVLKGLKINYTEYNDRPTISSAFDKGNLRVLFSAEAPQYLCRAQGNNIRIVDVSTYALQEIIVPIDKQILSVPDLRGKDIAVLAGTSSHYGLLKIMKQNNLSSSDVNIKFMSPNEAETAFETNNIDAWAVWAPWVEKQEVNGTARVLKGGDAMIISPLAMPYDFIENSTGIANAFVDVIHKAKAWMLENESEAQEIASKELNLDLSVIKQAWPKFHWDAQLNGSIIEDIQDKADFLTNMDKTRSDTPLNVKDEFIDTRFIGK